MKQFTREEHQQYYDLLVKMSKRASEILAKIKKELPDYFNNIETVQYDSVESYMTSQEFCISYEDDFNKRCFWVPFDVFFGESPLEKYIEKMRQEM